MLLSSVSSSFIHSDKGLSLKMLASFSLHGGNLTFQLVFYQTLVLKGNLTHAFVVEGGSGLM